MSRKSKYLFRRSSGNYYLVMKIPSDLQATLCAKWVRRSLKTSDPKDATILLNSMVGKIQSSFALLRSGMLSPEQIMVIRASILPCKQVLVLTPAKSLHDLISLYISEKSPNWSLATKVSFEQKFQCIKSMLGNKNVGKYTREDFLDYRNKLLDSGFQPKTINMRITLLASLLKWGVRHGYLTNNHAEGLQLKLDKAPDEQRKAYDDNDLKRIIDNLPRSRKYPWQYWIPLISMYSGMRREEICQLRACDIVEIDSIWCFKIVSDLQSGLKVKTEASLRIVPLHPFLLNNGFLEFVSQSTPTNNIWGFKRYNSTGDYGKKFGNWYSAFNKKIVTQDPLKCFHSFRHTFADRLKQVGIQESIIAELLGHKNNSITMSRYGKKYDPKVLSDVLKGFSLKF